ncbi:MAG: anthranilate phosphoribosyltransferase [Planctomycetaceae bacterium]|jgi:anthranilate phosphoribosyltransferase|nr:anthranilate phosphoribosyltransferase [Planctomycetaceae bacterium]
MLELSIIERFRFALLRLINREDLSAEEVEGLFGVIFSGTRQELTAEESVLLSGFLAALGSKGVTVQELVGAARSLRYHACRIQAIGSPVVDIVGTGGDSLNTINVSTTSSFVISGAGVVVAKHGNRAVSSRSGSADVLEACGVNLKLPPERVEELIAEIGIGFLFAQQFHPAMRRVALLRKYLGIRTLFNLLGPLTNPAGASCVLIGVYEPRLTEVFAATLKELGCKRIMTVYGYDGMDELTLTTRSRVTQYFDTQMKTYDLFPELYFGGELADLNELRGGNANENATILKGILNGTIKDGKRNIVLLNSAAALFCAEKAKSIEDGIKIATDSIDSGKALEKLQLLIKKSNVNI